SLPTRRSSDLYFTKSFKTDEYFQFEIAENQIFNSVQNIFQNPSELVQHSEKIAQKFYQVASNPKLKGGELFVVYFPDSVIEGENEIGRASCRERVKIRCV